ncbi:MAG: S9 family peptidase [Muribaculaceae bacterium]|nr:S9 family peptidase [Muribaculaceae bacterium]
MNKSSLAMGALILPLCLATSCKEGGSEENVIEKPEINIVDGQMTPEVLEALGQVNGAVASPDGKTIAFTIKYEDVKENKGNSEIYTVPAEGGEVTRLTHTAGSEGNLQWINGGERLAYLGKDTQGKMQIFSMQPDGRNVTCHSAVESGVECFLFSPDSKKVVYSTSIKDFNQNDSALFAGLDKTSGRLVDDLMYKHWDEWVESIPHPFVADFDGADISGAKDIMEGEPFECPMKPFGGAESFAWSPDSKQLVYVSRKLKGMEYAFSTDSDLFLYDLESGKTECLTPGEEWPGYDTDPAFSPDGKSLAFLSMKTAKYESDKKRLMVMDMASRDVKDLTADWDRWPEGIAWTPDSKEIVFNGYSDGVMPIFKISVADAKIEVIADGQYDYVGVQPLGDTGKVACMRHSMLEPNDIYVAETGSVKQLTEINKDILSQLAEVKVEKHLVPTTDGKEMTCWVILPPNFDPNKKYPAILYCQGGPQQAVSQFWSYRWNFRIMASQGYVIIAPNRRGLPGFGEEWNRQISGDYCGQNMRDYFSASDYIAAQPYVDEKKIGAIGASYGGFSVYWLAGHHEGRFAALVAHAGIFNMEAQYLETEEMWFADFDMGGAPWDSSNATAQRTFATSPHKFVNNWTAPILVTVGELDYRILASQGMMAFNAAKMHGLEAEMLVFPDENHWILKPQNAILWQRTFFRFLDKYLK